MNRQDVSIVFLILAVAPLIIKDWKDVIRIIQSKK